MNSYPSDLIRQELDLTLNLIVSPINASSLLPFNANPFTHISPTFFPPPLHRSPLFSPPALHMVHIELRPFLNVVNRVFMASITCGFAFGGALVGIFVGAINGQTTETGLVRGSCVGAVTGAITALQIMDMMANGEPFSKVALLHSLLNGKVFIEWVSPAVLKAYQWQTSAMEMSFTDIFDTDNNESRGLPEVTINKLPIRIFENLSMMDQRDEECNETNCAICLQDFKNKEEGRELPNCRHIFHVKCIDEWLIRQGSCPICRRDV
ncbi:NEP1-interacting protein 1 [Tanacetum coccineum]